MKIFHTANELQRSDRSRELNTPSAREKKEAAQPTSETERSDRVQISDAGKALAAKQANSTLTPERIVEVRQKIDSGAYNTPEMAEEVAKQILKSGDLAA
jgi:negative regulator of flagellin synthesis FlgM